MDLITKILIGTTVTAGIALGAVSLLKAGSQLTLDKSSYSIGQTINFSAKGVAPNTDYDPILAWGSNNVESSNVVVIPGFTSDANGNVNGTFLVGSNIPTGFAQYMFGVIEDTFISSGKTAPCDFPASCPPAVLVKPVSIT